MPTDRPPTPRISVIIPTVGRREHLRDTLADLARQELALADWECVVVAQGGADIAGIAPASDQASICLRILYCDEPNASLARNVGLLAARAPIALFIDDDVRVSDAAFLENHLLCYRDVRLPGVAGRILDEGGCGRATRHPRSRRPEVGWLYFPLNYDKSARVRSGSSCNLSVRREWALAVGGMDAQFERGAHREESDFCMRLTARYGALRFEPRAWLVHRNAPTGGCRPSDRGDALVAPHHAAGEWYFILRNLRAGRIRPRDLPDHLFCLFRRQIWTPNTAWKPFAIARAVGRSFTGYRAAADKIRQGPRLIRRDERPREQHRDSHGHA